MNLCSLKWNEPDFLQKNIAEEIQSTLAQCGLVNQVHLLFVQVFDVSQSFCLGTRMDNKRFPDRSTDPIHNNGEQN